MSEQVSEQGVSASPTALSSLRDQAPAGLAPAGLQSADAIPPLTAKEAKALDTAVEAILTRLALMKGASLTIGLQNYHGMPGHDLTFFTVGNVQHNGHHDRPLMSGTPSEKLNAAIAIQNDENANQGELRALRVKQLREQLAALEAEQAP